MLTYIPLSLYIYIYIHIRADIGLLADGLRGGDGASPRTCHFIVHAVLRTSII